MEFKDKAAFYAKLSRAATAVGKRIGREETDVFFSHEDDVLTFHLYHMHKNRTFLLFRFFYSDV